MIRIYKANLKPDDYKYLAEIFIRGIGGICGEYGKSCVDCKCCKVCKMVTDAIDFCNDKSTGEGN